MPKKLYKATFNWYGELHTLYRYAHSVDAAKGICCLQVAKTLGVSKRRVWNFFNGEKDNYTIEEERK